MPIFRLMPMFRSMFRLMFRLMPVPNAIHIDAPTEPKKAEDFTRRDVERDAVNRSGGTEGFADGAKGEHGRVWQRNT